MPAAGVGAPQRGAGAPGTDQARCPNRATASGWQDAANFASALGDALGNGYASYPSWLAGLEEYFRLLRLVFMDAWHEDEVEQIAQNYLSTLPGRMVAPAVQPLMHALARSATLNSAKRHRQRISRWYRHKRLLPVPGASKAYRTAFQAG